MNPNTHFICEGCGLEFEKAWTDEEAEKECKGNFGMVIPVEQAAIVCDDCYNKITETHKLN